MRRPYMNEDLLKQLRMMEEWNSKAEIQILGHVPVNYIMEKIVTKQYC